MVDTQPAEAALKAECQAAAYRAGQVHMWLDPILRKSLAAERAYTFKGRTKSDVDIFNKVQGRRHHEDAAQRRPDYGPGHVTDASGFRIVKLFNAEVPQALDDLLSLLKTTLPTGDLNGRLKVGGGLGNGIEEIEFHTSRRPEDPLSIYTQVKDVVKKHGLELKPLEQGRASSYSSVHILLECEVGKDIRAASEIQIRSVFEEAWSEISHRLRYAPAKLARALSAAPGSEQPHSHTDLWLHLDALKSLTDGCAQYADLINRQLQTLSVDRAPREPSPLDATEKSSAMFAQCGPLVHKMAEEAYRLRTLAVEGSGPAIRAKAFQTAADKFKSVIEAFPAAATPHLRRLHDVLLEELAFCYMFTQNEELRNQAEKIYRELLTAWPDRVSILLRLAQLRRDAGAFAEARELMERGLAASNHRPDPDPDVQRQASWLLRRDLAYICWSLVDLDPNREDAVPMLRRAITLSQDAQKFVRTEVQDLTTRVNLLYYRIDLWKKLPEGQRENEKAEGSRLLAELRPKLDLENWPVERLDTIARGEAAFGLPDLVKPVAAVISRILAERIATIRRERNCSHVAAFDALSRDEQDMYLNAQDLLANE